MADDGETLGLEDETMSLIMKDEQRVPLCSLDLSLQGEVDKNPVNATCEQIRNHLPDDLVFFILSKLPLKSLKRFTCVCKLWALLFENPHFMKIFLNNFTSNWSYNYQDTSLLLCRIVPHPFNSSLFSVSNESIQNMVKLEWPNPFEEDDDRCFFVMGSTSINGMLCLYQRHGPTIPVVLWNPITEEIKVIPPSPVESVPPNQEAFFKLIGFGYDRVRDDYKVIRYACFFPAEDDFLPNGEDYMPYSPELQEPDRLQLQEPLWEIYSLRSNSWRTLDVNDSDMPYCHDYINRLYLDGMCHWIGDSDNSDTYLVSFDLSNEVFYTTDMPFDIPSSKYSVRYLLLLNESVSVITNPTDTTDFYISILAQVGVKESWTRLFILESLPCIIRPLGIGKKGNILFVKNTDDSELVQFDLSTHMIEELGVKGAQDWSQIVLYKETFLPIGEINN